MELLVYRPYFVWCVHFLKLGMYSSKFQFLLMRINAKMLKGEPPPVRRLTAAGVTRFAMLRTDVRGFAVAALRAASHCIALPLLRVAEHCHAMPLLRAAGH
jgi:hypothetical protein